MEISGLLPIAKAPGITSKDVSRSLIKKLGKKIRIGHVGTLDPAASGVLPILLGRATRLQDFLLDSPKTYLFDIKLGVETDTLDSEGTIVKTSPTKISKSAIENVLTNFIGEITQIPPIYSAIKVGGKKLYEYARNGIPIDMNDAKRSRSVAIYAIEFIDFNEKLQYATLRANVGKGTYVRALGRDIAAAAGTIATVTRIVREESARISLNACIPSESIDSYTFDVVPKLIPINEIKLGIPRIVINDFNETTRLEQGQRINKSLTDRLDFSSSSRSITPGTVVLTDSSGICFGLGQVEMSCSSSFSIQMKRGLR